MRGWRARDVQMGAGRQACSEDCGRDQRWTQLLCGLGEISVLSGFYSISEFSSNNAVSYLCQEINCVNVLGIGGLIWAGTPKGYTPVSLLPVLAEHDCRFSVVRG